MLSNKVNIRSYVRYKCICNLVILLWPRITVSDLYTQKAHLQNAKIGFIINPIRQPLDPNSWTGGFASLSYLSFALAMFMQLYFMCNSYTSLPSRTIL